MNAQAVDYLSATEGYFLRNYEGKPLSAEPPDPALPAALEAFGFEPRGMRVLEVGCGAARNLVWLTREFGCDCVGIEPSETVVARLRSELPALGFQAGWSYELPCADDSFDMVLIYGVLSVVERNRILQSIGEALRVTKRWLMFGEYVALNPFRLRFKHHADAYCYHTDFEPIVLGTGAALLNSSQVVVHERIGGEPCVRIINHHDTHHDLDRFKTCLFEKDVSATPLKTFADFAV